MKRIWHARPGPWRCSEKRMKGSGRESTERNENKLDEKNEPRRKVPHIKVEEEVICHIAR